MRVWEDYSCKTGDYTNQMLVIFLKKGIFYREKEEKKYFSNLSNNTQLLYNIGIFAK